MELDEIRASLATVEPAVERYITPFSRACDSLVAQLESTDSRFRLGIAAIDLLTRGFGPKELIYMSGFAHSGKTQVLLTGILNNPDKRVIFFSLDDPAEMLLMKLCCMQHGVAGDVLERRIREHDDTARNMLMDTVESFPNLLVVDDSLGVRGMTQAIKEAEDHWGAEPHLVAVDYLELLSDVGGESEGDESGVKGVSKKLKRWVKSRDYPLLVIHQNTRSRGAPGEPITMLSMAHGGEQEGTMVIGVRRKRDNEKMDPWERQAHVNTITVHVAKNKRPPSKLTPPEGVDLFIDPMTGSIRPLREGDGRPGLEVRPSPLETAEQALAEARKRMESLGEGA